MSRWLTLEREGEKIVKFMCEEVLEGQIEYSRILYEQVHKDDDDYDPEDWPKILAQCRCFHDPSKTSYLCLLLLELANSSPRGKIGEGFINISSILGFLCSSHHRIQLQMLAEMYSSHKYWAAFYDSASSDLFPNVETNTTRFLEASVVNRRLIESVSTLQDDWKAALPRSWKFIQAEAPFYHSTQIEDSSQSVDDALKAMTLVYDKIMKKQVRKYCIKQMYCIYNLY
jgi:hypothetical protein